MQMSFPSGREDQPQTHKNTLCLQGTNTQGRGTESRKVKGDIILCGGVQRRSLGEEIFGQRSLGRGSLQAPRRASLEEGRAPAELLWGV